MSEEPYLLAKSKNKNGKSVSLQEHLEDTESAALFLLRDQWKENWFRFWKIPPEKENSFILHLRIACLWHDLGKANEDFLSILERKIEKQMVTHEHLSALLFSRSDVLNWLQNKVDCDVIFSAIVNHHLRICENKNTWLNSLSSNQEINVYLQSKQVQSILDRIAVLLDISSFHFSESQINLKHDIWLQASKNGRKLAQNFENKKNVHLNFLAALKCGLILADTISSGIIRVFGEKEDEREIDRQKIDLWLKEVQENILISSELREKVIEPKIKNFSSLFSFQEKLPQHGSRVLLLSPCGSGKTTAAYLWAEEQLKTNQYQKVIFLYPTRGTANEGFKDYLLDSEIAKLLHASAEYFCNLQGIRTSDDPEIEKQLFALANWKQKIFSATFDQFLSFLGQNRNGISNLPLLWNSVLIIDEIHSFDSQSFNLLLSLLQNFDLPVLGMTASLPQERKKELEKYLSVFSPEEVTSDYIRYNIKYSDKDTCLKQMHEALEKKQKVLWVTNTVSRAQKLAKKLNSEGIEALCYHSRFKLGDREKIHAKVMGLLQGNNSGIVVSTQVSEMSLDIDVDLLISEICPVPALVQRLGRVARKRKIQGRAFIYLDSEQKFSKQPYEEMDIISALQFIKDIDGKDLTNQNLNQKMQEFFISNLGSFRKKTSLPYLFSSFWSDQEKVREDNNFTVPVILDSDLDSVEDKIKNHQPYDDFILSIPNHVQNFSPQKYSFLPKFISVIFTSKYTEQYGFEEKQ